MTFCFVGDLGGGDGRLLGVGDQRRPFDLVVGLAGPGQQLVPFRIRTRQACQLIFEIVKIIVDRSACAAPAQQGAKLGDEPFNHDPTSC